MKATSILLAIFCGFLFATTLAADTIPDQLKGTWSGNWTPTGGVSDAMTIEIKYDDTGKLTGRFVNPASMNFTQARFNEKTRLLTLEALDPKSGQPYKLNAKMEGTELKGTVTAGTETGQIHLVKWTFVPGVR